jgi:hypothetical protein
MDKLGKLVAVKMLDRVLCDVNDRTRIAFVREVEVLRVCLTFFLWRLILTLDLGYSTYHTLLLWHSYIHSPRPVTIA